MATQDQQKPPIGWEWIAPIKDCFLLQRLKRRSERFSLPKKDDVSLHAKILERFTQGFEDQIDKETFDAYLNLFKSKGFFFDDLSQENKTIARECFIQCALNRYSILIKDEFLQMFSGSRNLMYEGLSSKMISLFENNDASVCFEKLDEISKHEQSISLNEPFSKEFPFVVPALPKGFDYSIFSDERIYFVTLIGLFRKKVDRVWMQLQMDSNNVRKAIQSPQFSDYGWMSIDLDKGIKFRSIDEHQDFEEVFSREKINVLERIVVSLYHFTKSKSKDPTFPEKDCLQVGFCYEEFVKLWISKKKEIYNKLIESKKLNDVETQFIKFRTSSLDQGSCALLALEFEDELIREMFPSVQNFEQLSLMYANKLNLYSNLRKKNQEIGSPLNQSEKLLCILFDLSCLKNSSLKAFKEIYGKSWLANPAYVVPDSPKVQVKHSLHIFILKDWLRLFASLKTSNPFETKKFCHISPIPARFLNDPNYFDVAKLYFGFVNESSASSALNEQTEQVQKLRPLNPEEIRSFVEDWKRKYLISYDLEPCCLSENESGDYSETCCPIFAKEEQKVSLDLKSLFNEISYVGPFKYFSSLPPKDIVIDNIEPVQEKAIVIESSKEVSQIQQESISNVDLETLKVIESNKELEQYSSPGISSGETPQPLPKIRPWISPYYETEGNRFSVDSFHLIRFPSSSAFDLRKEPIDHFTLVKSNNPAAYNCFLPPSEEEWSSSLWNRCCKMIFWTDHILSIVDQDQIKGQDLKDDLDSTVESWWEKTSDKDFAKFDSGLLWLKFREGNLPLYELIQKSWICFLSLAENKVPKENATFLTLSPDISKRIKSTYQTLMKLDDRPRILPPLPAKIFASDENPKESFLNMLKELKYDVDVDPIQKRFVEGYWTNLVYEFYGVEEDSLQSKLLKIDSLSLDHLFLKVNLQSLNSEMVNSISSMGYWEKFMFWLFCSGNVLRSDSLVSKSKNIGNQLSTFGDFDSSDGFIFEGTELIKKIATQWKKRHQFSSKEKSIKSLETFYSISDLHLFRLAKKIKFLEKKQQVCLASKSENPEANDIHQKCSLLKVEKQTYENMVNNIKSLQTLSKSSAYKEGLKNMGPLFVGKLDPFVLKSKFLDWIFEDIQEFKPKSQLSLLDPRLIPPFSNFVIPTEPKEIAIVKKSETKRSEWILVHSEMLNFKNSTVYSTLRERSKLFEL